MDYFFINRLVSSNRQTCTFSEFPCTLSERRIKQTTTKKRMKGRTKRIARSSSYNTLSSSSSEVEQEIIIRKGPWKAEEDEVLLKHVNKYGPRDWSSLLSKGLLQRTGKSCRLRWVNKLRPNLKNGCKFSADEERVVIELQAQLGNKWAKISTHLPGRTDNDVKNFWSSRQKRLARLLLNNQQQSPKPKSMGPDSDPVESSSKAIEVAPLTMIDPTDLFELPQNLPFLEPASDLDLDFMSVFSRGENSITSAAIGGDHDDDQALMQLSSEMASYLEPFEGTGFSNQQLDGEIKNGERGGNDVVFDPIPLTPDRFFDDLPSDIFDHMEPIPSPPSDW